MKNTITQNRLAQIVGPSVSMTDGDNKTTLANEDHGTLNAAQRRAMVQSETEKEMRSRGCSYEEAFQTVITLYPELATGHPSLANDGDGNAAQRTVEIQKWIQAWCKDQGLDPSDAADYSQAFQQCLKQNPKWASAMHQPLNPGARSQNNSGTGDKTPPRNLQSQRPAHVTTTIENPAQRAERIRTAAQGQTLEA